MKKSAILSALFVFTFVATFGFVISLSENAYAAEQCAFLCLTELDRSYDTGPLCPQDCPASMIYYIWRVESCQGGPLNCPNLQVFAGCWDGVNPFGCMPGIL
jgi:hypothetical protein